MEASRHSSIGQATQGGDRNAQGADALGPNDVQTLHHLGLIHNRLGHNVQAKDYMKRAAEARSKLKLKGGMGA